MHPLTYLSPRDLDEAARLAGRPGARIIAGGTNLVDLMKLGVETPDLLIDVTNLALDSIEDTSSGLRLGALARNSDVAYHPTVQGKFPLLSQALLAGASSQLRNMATVGGNLLQRTRCPYFNDTAFPCNKRQPGSGCPAVAGFSRMHAVLGVSDHCIAANPSDMSVALVALEAQVRVRSAQGERVIPIGEFHREPGTTPHLETSLAPGEIIVAVELPVSDFAAHSAYRKVRDRASYEFAIVSVAAALAFDGRRVKQARLAFGGVGTRPWRSREAEKALEGQEFNDKSRAAAAAAAAVGAKTTRHNAFKVDLLRRTIRQTLASFGEEGHEQRNGRISH